MKWQKQGLIFSDHHAQVPVTLELEDRFKIYYSTRDKENQSLAQYIEVDKDNNLSVTTVAFSNFGKLLIINSKSIKKSPFE